MLESVPMSDEPTQDWSVDESHTDKNRFKKYGKNHAREVASCFANLATVVGHLKAGEALGSFRLNFFRRESGDIWRIGQTGVPSARETRLYLLILVLPKTIHVLTIGDKDTQQADLAKCKQIESAIHSNT